MNNPPLSPPASLPSPVPSESELISRHFDDDLSPEEHQRLEQILRSHPQALLDFAATARLHQQLEDLAPRDRSRRSVKRFPRWLRVTSGVAAAAILTLGGFGFSAVFRDKANHSTQAKVTVRDILPPVPSDPTTPVPANHRKRIVKAAGATTLPAAPVDIEELLGRYYVNASPHGLTVPQALKQLEQAIRDVNLLNRPELNALRFTAGASFEPDVEDPVVRTPLMAPMTVKTYLETCALFGQTLRQPGGVLYSSTLDEAPDKNDVGGKLITMPYTVPEDFLSSGAARTIYKGGTYPDFSPFSTNPERLEPAWKKVQEYFVPLSEEGSTVTFVPASQTLVLKASRRTHELFVRRLEFFLAHRSTPQIFTSSKILSMRRMSLPGGFDENSGMTFDDREFQLFMRNLSQTPGVNLSTLPSVIARQGQLSKIEIIREISPPTNGQEAEDGGLTVSVEALRLGEFIRVQGTVDTGFLGKVLIPKGDGEFGTHMDLREPEASDGKPHHFATEYEVWLPDNSTAIFTLDIPLAKTPSGEDQVASFTISATSDEPSSQSVNFSNAPTTEAGKETANSEIPFGVPVPDKPGFVFSPYFPTGMVDVTGISPGTKVRCPYTSKVFRAP